MPAVRKYPDELRRRAIRLVLGVPWPIRIGLGVWACRRLGLGVNPETLRGWVRQARVGVGEEPAPPGVEAQRLWELEKEVRELGGGGAIRRGASALLPWRSVSARRADPRLHRGPEGGVGTHAGSALP